MKRITFAVVSAGLALLLIALLTGLPALSPGLPGAPGGPVSGTMLDIAYAQDAWNGGRFDGPVVFAGPTAGATATILHQINQNGLGVIMSVEDASTPVLSVYNGGGSRIYAPTAVATAVPALNVDTAGVSNVLSLRKNATPVLQVAGDGTVNGKVLSYGTKGGMAVIGSSAAVSSSVTVASGLTTLSACFCSLGNDFAADGGFCSAAVSTTNCVLKAWKINSTPTAASASQTVYWLAIGVQ